MKLNNQYHSTIHRGTEKLFKLNANKTTYVKELKIKLNNTIQC
jgi:hypothetical protein